MGPLNRYTIPARHRGRVLDGMVAAGCAVGVTPLATEGSIYSYLDWRPPPWLLVPLAVGVGVSAWNRRRWPVQFAVVALAGWAALAGIAAVVVAQYTVAERSRSWRVTAAGTVMTLALVGPPIWWLGGLDASLPVSVALCVAPALLGLYVGTRRELITQMRARAERAEHDQDLRVQQARSEERAQIARDMHDVVTHRVSLMVLHATALEAARGRDSATLARQIGEIGRATLDELRSLVAVLRADGATGEAPLTPQPGLADLPDLVEQSCDLGLPVTLEITGEPDTPPPALVEHALYRVAQEALTNVRKHAGAPSTLIQVHHEPHLLRLTVANAPGTIPDTAGRARRLPRGGHGLLGIAERVRLVGGELTTWSTPDGGFRVEATTPLAPERDR